MLSALTNKMTSAKKSNSSITVITKLINRLQNTGKEILNFTPNPIYKSLTNYFSIAFISKIPHKKWSDKLSNSQIR